MDARDIEAAMLNRCAEVARCATQVAQDQREANIFRLAAVLIESRFPQEANSLKLASEQYFTSHPDELLASAEVVRKGWLMNLPRLRVMLTRQLS